MKKNLAVLIPLLVLAVAAIAYFTSNLSRRTATATFSADEEREGLNELRVKAPYGYYVIHYSVVPRSPGVSDPGKPFTVGGSGVANRPIGLFGDDAVSSSVFPDRGVIDDIPVETHVRIASNLNTAATAEIPKDESILSRCGIYLMVTRDRSVFRRLTDIVEHWTIGAEPSDREAVSITAPIPGTVSGAPHR